MDNELLLDSIILKTEVGSTAHGTGIEGEEDYDEMAIAVEPTAVVYGLETIDTLVYRPGRSPEDPSQPGDYDLVIHPLKKWMSLALNANPSVLLMLWSNVTGGYEKYHDLIRSNADKFVSQRIFDTHIGYAAQQANRLRSGKFYKSRQKIVEKYGYDTKYAMHALRLILQGQELATTGRLSMPIAEPNRQLLIDIRCGKYSKDDFFDMFHEQTKVLEQMHGKTDLPLLADYKWANKALQHIYCNYYFDEAYGEEFHG